MKSELSTNSKPRGGASQKEDSFYKSTCNRCKFRGNKFADEDWINLNRYNGPNSAMVKQIVEVDKFPKRCTPCDTRSRRYTRMGKTLDKIREIKDDIVSSAEFSRPKMITIQNKEQLSKEEFTRRLKIFHRECPWLIGGTFVKELGTKPMGDYNGMWHSHGVYIAPYLSLEEANKEVETYGLCLGKYKEAKINKDFTSSGLMSYITKYLCKEGGRKQSVGALYRCVQEEIEILDSHKTIKIWKQPNKNYQTQMREWINGN